ncbi:unnamed protein product [Urochloa humidicola]
MFPTACNTARSSRRPAALCLSERHNAGEAGTARGAPQQTVRGGGCGSYRERRSAASLPPQQPGIGGLGDMKLQCCSYSTLRVEAGRRLLEFAV